MAGKQDWARPDRETIRKAQIYDDSGKLDSKWKIENHESSADAQGISSNNRSDDFKPDETKNIDVHSYTLSIMNEANKVLFILKWFAFTHT